MCVCMHVYVLMLLLELLVLALGKQQVTTLVPVLIQNIKGVDVEVRQYLQRKGTLGEHRFKTKSA